MPNDHSVCVEMAIVYKNDILRIIELSLKEPWKPWSTSPSELVIYSKRAILAKNCHCLLTADLSFTNKDNKIGLHVNSQVA